MNPIEPLCDMPYFERKIAIFPEDPSYRDPVPAFRQGSDRFHNTTKLHPMATQDVEPRNLRGKFLRTFRHLKPCRRESASHLLSFAEGGCASQFTHFGFKVRVFQQEGCQPLLHSSQFFMEAAVDFLQCYRLADCLQREVRDGKGVLIFVIFGLPFGKLAKAIPASCSPNPGFRGNRAGISGERRMAG